jgi:hypothetical protein
MFDGSIIDGAGVASPFPQADGLSQVALPLTGCKPMYVAVRSTLYGNAYQAPGAAERPMLGFTGAPWSAPTEEPIQSNERPHGKNQSNGNLHENLVCEITTSGMLFGGASSRREEMISVTPASSPVPLGPAPYARCGGLADFHSIE